MRPVVVVVVVGVKKCHVRSSFRPSQAQLRFGCCFVLLLLLGLELLCSRSCPFIIIISKKPSPYTRARSRRVNAMPLATKATPQQQPKISHRSLMLLLRPSTPKLAVQSLLGLPAVEVGHQAHAEEDDPNHGGVRQRVY